MKVNKAIIGAAIGTAVGGTAGYFIGREVERRAAEDEMEFIDTDLEETPAIETAETAEAEAPAEETVKEA